MDNCRPIEDKTFQTLFTEIKAGKFDCVEVIDELKQATLTQTLVGSDKEKLMFTSVSQSLCSVSQVN